MKNNFKFLTFAIVGLALTSCTKTDLAPDNLQGSWSLTWVKDFSVDIPNAEILGNLCNPGATVDLNFAGVGEARFSGNRTAFNPNAYIRLGDRANNSTPNTTLASKSFYVDCNDIIVSSIEHREIYITGQPGYITKKAGPNGSCQLQSDPSRTRTRPYYTVFINLAGSASRAGTNGTEYDDTNRLAGITYNCDNGRLISVNRVSNPDKKSIIEVPFINSPNTFKELDKNKSILNNPGILNF